MAFFGGYFGVGGTVTVVVTPTPPSPVESPLPETSAELVDHISDALDRLPEYAKAKAR